MRSLSRSRNALVLVALLFALWGQAPSPVTSVHVNAKYTAAILTCTTTTANLTYATVSAAVSAAAAGDTVCLPAGTATWATTLTLTKAITLANVTGCTLDGNGRPTDGTCATVITGTAHPVIAFDPASPAGNPLIRVTRLGLTCSGSIAGIQALDSSTTLALTNERIDHNVIKNCNEGTHVESASWWVVDHNLFKDNTSTWRFFGYGNESTTWTNFPANAGDANKPYHEDNTIENASGFTFIAEGGQGGKCVIRHNIITSTTISGGPEVFDMHGNQDVVPGTSRGTIECEIHDNTVTLATGQNWRLLNLRGGDAKIFNNTFSVLGANGGSLEMTEYDIGTLCSHYGFLSAWPGYDPIQNAYFFNNLVDGSYQSPQLGCAAAGDATMIQSGRDYFEPSYGLASARPGTCTDLTYYGATDTGVVSKCHPANTWATVYTPYTYPHPKAVG
jgi:hypothetical protein